MEEEQIKTGRNPYGLSLASNINKALPDLKAAYFGGKISLYLPSTSIGEKASLKGWLYTLLDTLPEIEHPLERIHFIIYVDDAIENVILINPSELDVQALDRAIND